MLSLFPQILFLAPLGLALLRLAAGLTFFGIACSRAGRHTALAEVRFPVVGSGAWIVWLAIIVEGGVGVALIAGAYTQLAAVFGALLAIKSLAWHKRYPQLFPLEQLPTALLLAICLSLVVSGAGAFALDLPL